MSADQVSRRRVLTGMTAGALVGGLAPQACRDHAYHLVVSHHTLKLKRWDAPGLKVALLSDLHLNGDSQTARAIHAVELARAEKPDLIAIGGDYVEHDRPNVRKYLKEFAQALADSGIPTYSVLGNHDYWSMMSARVVDELHYHKVHVLRNQAMEFRGVTIAGIDDAIDRRQRFDFLDRQTSSKSLLSLLHEPDFVEEQPAFVSLQLSGHSHGGQVCGPGGRVLHTPAFGRKYPSGFYPHTPVPLYVSRGVGTTGPDLRAFCPPEVAVLTLESA